MNAEATLAVSAAVVAFVQMLKWANYVPPRWAPLAIWLAAAVGVGVWAYSVGVVERTAIWQYFAGWIQVSLGAAGVYGFTRQFPDVVSQFTTKEDPRG